MSYLLLLPCKFNWRLPVCSCYLNISAVSNCRNIKISFAESEVILLILTTIVTDIIKMTLCSKNCLQDGRIVCLSSLYPNPSILCYVYTAHHGTRNLKMVSGLLGVQVGTITKERSRTTYNLTWCEGCLSYQRTMDDPPTSSSQPWRYRLGLRWWLDSTDHLLQVMNIIEMWWTAWTWNLDSGHYHVFFKRYAFISWKRSWPTREK